ncbi:hypothetical protein TVAG_432340 [Trichomonas vaginalis G3]|uniref:UDENN domain-containing protein n=1 Tax=Trichomonas vaginalis (strain ATCC PRA-98 / G3) TaxID=412133 RepID=A2F8U8_TRIV3|nr:Fam45A-related family [Trichomonas vaginalis G3]EAX98684.1 hypothetical protein TVAG_432340 [Trichomonas vaginalis G3]KAI5545815.1 Fam45A-related family [Trichomonas vaginalis G3]|eukprot:XP_001311614.1 hypothetical protein [Trichomonas vaginalis G3]
MQSNVFVIYEYDDNEETLVTFVYPSIDKETKSVIQETAHHIITQSTASNLFSSYKKKWLYFDNKRNQERSDNVRIYGVCVVSEVFNPQLYLDFTSILSKIAADTKTPANVLRIYLMILSQGYLDQGGIDFSIENYGEYYTKVSFEKLLDRSGQHISVIWQALVTGRSVAVYSPDISILQDVTLAILCLSRPGKRNLLPLVLDNSILQTNAAQETALPIWCSSDQAILNGHFDLIVDLATRTIKTSPAFSKEAGKISLGEALMNTINEVTAAEGSVPDSILEFNESILEILGQIKQRMGELNAQTIGSVNLPADKKQLLIGIAASSVFEI